MRPAIGNARFHSVGVDDYTLFPFHVFIIRLAEPNGYSMV